MKTETAIEFINTTYSVGQFFIHEIDYRLKPLEISYQQAIMLMHIQSTGGCRPSVLATVFQYQTQSISSLLKRMEKKGLITREVDPYKKSAKLVKLTTTGGAVVNRAQEYIDEVVLDLELSNARVDLGNIRELWQVAELASYRRPTGTGARKPKQPGEFVRARRAFLMRNSMGGYSDPSEGPVE